MSNRTACGIFFCAEHCRCESRRKREAEKPSSPLISIKCVGNGPLPRYLFTVYHFITLIPHSLPHHSTISLFFLSFNSLAELVICPCRLPMMQLNVAALCMLQVVCHSLIAALVCRLTAWTATVKRLRNGLKIEGNLTQFILFSLHFVLHIIAIHEIIKWTRRWGEQEVHRWQVVDHAN